MRIIPTLTLETNLWKQGKKLVCGIDEVGKGCFAGPVVAGAVVFSPFSKVPDGIADSKLLKSAAREKLSKEIMQLALFWAVGVVEVSDINVHGIGQATQMAYVKAVKSLEKFPDFILVDAFIIKDFDSNLQAGVEEGDSICTSIAAASIIAKVYRDHLMEELEEKYPGYGFSKHKGYGTKAHREAMKQLGLCDIHRRSFNLGKFL